MREAGIDIPHKKTQSVFNVLKSGKLFNYVITVCDEAAAEKCPVFPNAGKKIHWSFANPSQVTGTEEEKLRKVMEIRDSIKNKIKKWCEEVCVKQAAW